MPIGLGLGLLLALAAAAVTWPGFFPRQIVVSGNHRVTRGEILARAAIAPRLSMWVQNGGTIADRVETIPYVATARIHRIPPGTIRIEVTEREPFALVRSGADVAVVDRSLRVLEPVTSPSDLPIFAVGPGLDLIPGSYLRTSTARELRDAYDEVAAAHIDAAELSLDRFNGLVVTTRDGLRLLLGSGDDLTQKLTLASAIRAQVIGRQRRVAAIDLRAPAAPVLVYR
jgi:cell division protein FtsQ